MSFRTYPPTESTSSPLVIVYINHAGSCLAEDAGRDAAYLAKTLDVPVIGAERPGTGHPFHYNRHLRRAIDEDYVATMGKLARSLCDELETIGAKTALVTGRSAGAVGAMAMTRTELLPVGSLYVADPGALHNYRTTREGLRALNDYGDRQKIKLESDNEALVRPNKPDLPFKARVRRYATMLPNFYNDVYHSQAIFRRPETVGLAGEIALLQPNVAVTMEFAEMSLADEQDTELIDRLAASLPALREGGAPFTVQRVENTVHASFDNLQFLATRIRPVVERALQAA